MTEISPFPKQLTGMRSVVPVKEELLVYTNRSRAYLLSGGMFEKCADKVDIGKHGMVPGGEKSSTAGRGRAACKKLRENQIPGVYGFTTSHLDHLYNISL